MAGGRRKMNEGEEGDERRREEGDLREGGR
jgi:hypothetical protein